MSAGTEGTEGNQGGRSVWFFLVLTSPYSFQNDWKTEDLLKCGSCEKSDKFSLCSFCHYLFCGLILSLFYVFEKMPKRFTRLCGQNKERKKARLSISI